MENVTIIEKGGGVIREGQRPIGFECAVALALVVTMTSLATFCTTLAMSCAKTMMAENDVDRKPAGQKDQVKVLKHNLEGWREILLPVNSLLMWERSYDPGILIGMATLVFLILWYFDPSVLTTFSVLGIITCIVDYLVPTLSANVFDPMKWTGIKERKFEEICKGIVNTWEYVSWFRSFMNNMKETKPKIYFVIVLSILLFIAWLGNQMDNLMLTYLIVCTMMLLPGMKHHGILQKYVARFIHALTQALGAKKQKKN